MSTQPMPSGDADDFIEVVIERRERSYAFGEPRVGVGFAPPLTTKTVSKPKAGGGGGGGGDTAGELEELAPATPAFIVGNLRERNLKIASQTADRFALRKLVQAFEELNPQDVLKSHGSLTSDVYVVAAEGSLSSVDKATVEKWVNSAEFKEASDATAAKPEIVELHIQFTDERTAIVTYSITQSGLTASSGLVAVRDDTGWKVAIHCPHPTRSS